MVSVISILLWLWAISPLVHSQEKTCTAGNEACSDAHKASPKQKLKATFRNLSPYRADVYFDDGRFGDYVGTLENNGDEIDIDTWTGRRYFITRHGVREGLVDPATDEQYFFNIEHNHKSVKVDFVIPSHAAPSKTKCKDRYPVCVEEAARGQCIDSPGWMIVNCCKSCDDKEGFGKYLDSKVRCTRERLNATIPAWEAGSLDVLFTKWATDDKYKQYGPKVISSPGKQYNAENDGPWIMTFDNFLDDYEIASLMRGATYGNGFQRSAGDGDVIGGSGEREMQISTQRTSSNTWCERECEELDGVKRVSARIEDLTGIPRNHYESFQILKYQVGEYYKSHHDSPGGRRGKSTSVSGHRILTFFLYLNDVPEGGETHFTGLDISIQPKKGKALVWPSVSNKDPAKSDMRMWHEALPVGKGIKYAANHWIHLYDSKNENLWGCSGGFA